MAQSHTATVVGSCIADICIRLPHLPALGQTVTGSSLTRSLGGKGANQAVGLSRLGISVQMVASVGDDEIGREFIGLFIKERVDPRYVVVNHELPTGTGIPLIVDSGQNAIVVVPAAAFGLSVRDVSRAQQAIRQSDALLLQFEAPTDALLLAMDTARESAVPVFLNPAPVMESSRKLVASADVVIANEEEALWITGVPAGTPSTAQEAAGRLCELGPKVGVVTLGAQGAVLSSPEFSGHVPAYDVTAVDPTGAGDAFCAGLVRSKLSGNGWRESVRFANACGALACMSIGTMASLPSEDDVLRFIAERTATAGASRSPQEHA